MYENRVEGITDADYQRAQPYVEAAQAFAQTTYQSIYIIDYYRKNFLYVSDNPLFLCGHTADEVRLMGYGFYLSHVPENEVPMLTELNRSGLYQPSLTVGMIKDWIKIPSPVGDISPKNPIGLIQSNNNLQLSPTLTASANLQIVTKGDQQNMTLTKASYVADISVTKTFFNNRLSVKLDGQNLFDSQQHINIRYGLRTLYQENHRDSRKLELVIRYNFNATNSKYMGTGAGSEEKSRF